MKERILVITGTRAEFGLLRTTIDALKKLGADVRILVTGMHTLKRHGNTEKEVKRVYNVAARVPVRESDDMAQALTREIEGIRAYCLKNRPDCIVVLGDRDEPLAAGLVAAHLNIPLAHIHGGDVSGTTTVDNIIRATLTKLAHLHFPTTKLGAKRIAAMGEEAWRIKAVGAPGIDEIRRMRFMSREKLARALDLDSKRPWLLIVHHPTPFDTTLMQQQIKPLLEAVTKDFPEAEKIVIYPNSDTGSNLFIQEIGRVRNNPRVQVSKTLPRELFLNTMHHAACILGNSSAGIIESASMKTPSVTIGSRQKGRERANNVVEVGYDRKSIKKAIRKATTSTFRTLAARAMSPYGNGTAGKTIARILLGKLKDKRLLHKRDPYV